MQLQGNLLTMLLRSAHVGSAAPFETIRLSILANRLPSRDSIITFFSQACSGESDSSATMTLSGLLNRIPDLDARADLQEFLASHRSAIWPEPSEAEHVLNDMYIYWQDGGHEEEPHQG